MMQVALAAIPAVVATPFTLRRLPNVGRILFSSQHIERQPVKVAGTFFLQEQAWLP